MKSIGEVLQFCDHGGAILSRNVANGGIGLHCGQCRRWVTKEKGYDRPWLGKDHPALAGIDLTQLPEVGARTYMKCEGPCGRLDYCELHHYSPRAFFGEACDDWRTGYLCRPCHEQWHRIMTPGLCTAYDPAAHAAQLLDYLGVDRAALLTKQLIQQGRARRGGEAA